jgi:hypothetical protein
VVYTAAQCGEYPLKNVKMHACVFDSLSLKQYPVHEPYAGRSCLLMQESACVFASLL